MAKRKMKESMDNITNIKDSTAALSPEMQLAKEKAKDKDEEFEKIVLGKDVVLGASKQPTPDKPKWSLDESLFDKPISFEFDESLKESFYWLSDSRINILKRLGYSSKEDLAFAENLCEEEGLDLEEIVNTLDDIYKNGKEKAEAFYRDFFVDEDGNPIEIDESLGVSSSVELAARKDVTDYFQKMLYDQFLENPPQAQELDIEINSYDAEWSPQEFDSVSEKKFNKVKSLIDQLSIALSDMYFDDSLLESLKEGVEISGEEDIWDLIQSGFVDEDMIIDFLSDHDTAFEDICKHFNITEDNFDAQCDALYGQGVDNLIDWITDHTQLWYDFCNEVYLIRDELLNGVDESLNEDLLYASNIDKEILDGAGDKNIRPITTGTREKCSISAINNLKALLSRGESASLCLGCMKLKNEDPDPNSWISHVWVKSENGDILETNVGNIDFNSREHYCVKEIKFDPKDFENIGYFYNKLESELGGKSVNESLLESSRKDKNMKRYIIEEMKEDDQITDIDAYNESRDAKIVKRYKSILGLDEDFEITEENLDDWALKHACNLEGANYDRAKAAVLGLKFEGYK